MQLHQNMLGVKNGSSFERQRTDKQILLQVNDVLSCVQFLNDRCFKILPACKNQLNNPSAYEVLERCSGKKQKIARNKKIPFEFPLQRDQRRNGIGVHYYNLSYVVRDQEQNSQLEVFKGTLLERNL